MAAIGDNLRLVLRALSFLRLYFGTLIANLLGADKRRAIIFGFNFG